MGRKNIKRESLYLDGSEIEQTVWADQSDGLGYNPSYFNLKRRDFFFVDISKTNNIRRGIAEYKIRESLILANIIW